MITLAFIQPAHKSAWWVWKEFFIYVAKPQIWKAWRVKSCVFFSCKWCVTIRKEPVLTGINISAKVWLFITVLLRHHLCLCQSSDTLRFLKTWTNLFMFLSINAGISNRYETCFQILLSLYHLWVSCMTERRRQGRLQNNLMEHRSRACRQSRWMLPEDQYSDTAL